MILRLSAMHCLRVSDDPCYNLSFRVLKGSGGGGGAEHWVPIKFI